MSYDVFKSKIRKLIAESDPGLVVMFCHDNDKGLHIARISNGWVITANIINPSITLKCGKNHTMMAVV